MARFFFDFFDTGEAFPDVDGLELKDIDTAKDEAEKALVEMASEIVPDGPWRELTCKIRDADGEELAHVRMTLEVDPK